MTVRREIAESLTERKTKGSVRVGPAPCITEPSPPTLCYLPAVPEAPDAPPLLDPAAAAPLPLAGLGALDPDAPTFLTPPGTLRSITPPNAPAYGLELPVALCAAGAGAVGATLWAGSAA